MAAVMFVTRKVNWHAGAPPPDRTRHPPGRRLTAGARRLIQLSLNPVYPIGAGKDNSLIPNRHELPAAVNHGP